MTMMMDADDEWMSFGGDETLVEHTQVHIHTNENGMSREMDLCINVGAKEMS